VVQRATRPAPKRRVLSTGSPSLDAVLGGGLTRGELHEIAAPASAGTTALVRAALAAATRAGELCALVDPEDSFDPRPADIDLRRLLWVRPRDASHALRAAEIALEARFSLVVLDLARTAPVARKIEGVHVVRFEFLRKKRAPGEGIWARLARCAQKHGGALVVCSREAQAGSFSATTIEIERERSRWEGAAGAPGRLLRGACTVAAVTRFRGGGASFAGDGRSPQGGAFGGTPSAPIRLQLCWEGG
jgi:recA bacterial DNA recombination protein